MIFFLNLVLTNAVNTINFVPKIFTEKPQISLKGILNQKYNFNNRPSSETDYTRVNEKYPHFLLIDGCYQEMRCLVITLSFSNTLFYLFGPTNENKMRDFRERF